MQPGAHLPRRINIPLVNTRMITVAVPTHKRPTLLREALASIVLRPMLIGRLQLRIAPSGAPIKLVVKLLLPHNN